MTGNAYSDDDSFGYDPRTETYRVPVDGGADSMSRSVIEAISAISDTEPSELEPLHTVVDPEALDRLFRPTGRGSRPRDGWVVFEYSSYRVTVYSYGVVEVRPADEDGLGEDSR